MSLKKIVWLDVETTGLENEHDIIELAIVIFIDNVPVIRKHWYIQPFRYDNISPKALEITGHTIEKIKTFLPPHQVYLEFIDILSKYVGKFDPKDKYYIGGFNVRFDIGFLSRFFIKNNDKYFGSFFNWKYIDVFSIVNILDFYDRIPEMQNRQLGTVCEKFNIDIETHNAMSDIIATIKLFNKLMMILGGKK